MKTSEVLRKAGDVLRERGWHRGWFVNASTGAVCMLGACNAAVTGYPDSHSAIDFLWPIDIVTGPDNQGLRADWNDETGRTAAEVMIALDAAFVVALQEEGLEPEDVL